MVMRRYAPIALAGVVALNGAADETPNIADQAAGLLAAMSAEQREAGTWTFADPERFDIRYLPLGHEGVRHGTLTDAAKEAGEGLLASLMSARGHARTRLIRQLELDVRQMEWGRQDRDVVDFRNPGRYFWAVFGEPVADAAWGFRLEGHHMSVNVTVVPGQPAATLPLFMGARPRVVPEGMPSAGVEVFREEERLLREIYASLDDSQRATATVAYKADRGLMLGEVPRLSDPAPAGLPRRDMNDRQRAMLDALLAEFAGLWNPEIEAARLREIETAREALHFAFASVEDPPFSFYARVSGPGVLVEIDNTQGGNHVHSVWHRPGADFGEDLLAAHLERHHDAPARAR